MSIFKPVSRRSLGRASGVRRWSLLAGIALVVSVQAPIAAAATLKIATVSPEGSMWMKSLRAAGKDIEAATDGRVKLKYYPGGVQGDDKVVMQKIRRNYLHGAVMTVGGLAATNTNIQLYSFPLLFNSYDEIDYVRERMDGALLAELAKDGFRAFGFSEVGFGYAMTKTRASSVEDMRERKVWIPDDDKASAQAVAAYGITPVPLSIADVLAGLQTGLINAVAAPPIGALALQWHTQIEHVLDLPLLYVYGVFAINDKAFSKLSAADQAIVSEKLAGVVRDVNRQTRLDNTRARQVLIDQGLAWHNANEAELATWQNLARVASDDLIEAGVVDSPLYREMVRHLDDFRRAQAAELAAAATGQ